MTPVNLVHCSSTGLGDNICIMQATTGLRAISPYPVVYKCHPNALDWVSLFDCADIITASHFDGVVLHEYFPFNGYKVELAEKGKRTRAEYYCQFAGNAKPVLPKVKPLPSSPYPGCICLVPRANWRVRQWEHWLTLAGMLGDHKVIILTDKKCEGYSCEVWQGKPAIEVCSLLSEANACCSGDTGIAHISASLGTKTIILNGGMRGASIYGSYPSAIPIEGKLPCSGCYWVDTAFPDCGQRCRSLQEITCEEVIDALTRIALPVVFANRPKQQVCNLRNDGIA